MLSLTQKNAAPHGRRKHQISLSSIATIVVFLQERTGACLTRLAEGLLSLAERVGNVDWSMEDTV